MNEYEQIKDLYKGILERSQVSLEEIEQKIKMILSKPKDTKEYHNTIEYLKECWKFNRNQVIFNSHVANTGNPITFKIEDDHYKELEKEFQKEFIWIQKNKQYCKDQKKTE